MEGEMRDPVAVDRLTLRSGRLRPMEGEMRDPVAVDRLALGSGRLRPMEGEMRDPVVVLALVGPHGAGKTTVGRLVAGVLGWPFDEEIGRRLRDEFLASDAGGHALADQPWFDERVIREELRRDGRSGSARVVETWHPGNLAYAQARSPGVAARHRAELGAAVAKRHRAFVQPLRIRPATALSRLSEPGPDTAQLVRFFREVGLRAERLAVELGAFLLPPLDTDDASPDALAGMVVEALHGHHQGHAPRARTSSCSSSAHPAC
jgi:hypothetical protein